MEGKFAIIYGINHDPIINKYTINNPNIAIFNSKEDADKCVKIINAKIEDCRNKYCELIKQGKEDEIKEFINNINGFILRNACKNINFKFIFKVIKY